MAHTGGVWSQGSKRSQSVGKSHLLKRNAIQLGVLEMKDSKKLPVLEQV